jgi:hypothetical protein
VVDYKDQFTLDGNLKPAHPTVTRRKVEEADRLLQRALRGDKIASGQLAEVHTTSDLPFVLAHLISATAIPQFQEAERTWNQVAGTRVVPTFDKVRLFSLYSDVTGAGVAEGPNGSTLTGGLPRVPEAAPYPYITLSGQEAYYSGVAKNGAAFGKTWESNVNDVEDFYGNVPNELVQLALDTEEREVYDALINGTTNELASQTLPDGTVTDPNAAISPEAIWAAILQLQNTQINGRKVGRASGYNVIVASGTGDFVNYALNRTILQVVDGSIVYGPGDRSALNNVTVVESDYVTGTNWYVIPKPGAIRRPVLELARLRGYEVPELRARGNTGVYLGSSAVVPFNEGSWENDTIDYRIRYVAGGIMWSTSYSLKSDGTGTA